MFTQMRESDTCKTVNCIVCFKNFQQTTCWKFVTDDKAKICREEGSNGCGNGDGRDEGAAPQQCESAGLARIQQTWQHEAAEYDQ